MFQNQGKSCELRLPCLSYSNLELGTGLLTVHHIEGTSFFSLGGMALGTDLMGWDSEGSLGLYAWLFKVLLC